ncbi:hypothetical protein CMV_024118 [Castanea mollissima]|uniref:DUF4283 domain-containing protein n=1 Tax=Castanea mollissima TaxID=60419 RepID=A0A8J4VIC5_9ROSI|nr:hypothetical protein CMV_024118 [Castanea mollissima]
MERENVLTLSSKEKNELICSTKKVIDNHHGNTKRTDNKVRVTTDAAKPKLSFKKKLVGEILGAFAQAFDLTDKEETDMVPRSFEVDMESDEIRELREGVVAAKISQGLKQRIQAPWSKALIVRVYGRTGKISFSFVFPVKEDHNSVLKNGPWFIGENFLSIRPWEPNFKPAMAVVLFVAVWVRLNERPIKYYDSEALLIIDQTIGNVLRIDTHTETGTRGRYARLCIQVDIEKPLANAVLVDNIEQPITYEGLHRFYFSCGRIGHRREECVFRIRKPSPERSLAPEGQHVQTSKDNDVEVHSPCAPHEVGLRDDKFGPWMLVSRRKASIRKDKKHDLTPTNARYAVWHEGADERIGPGDAAKVTPRVGGLKINEGKRKANGELVQFGEPLKEQLGFRSGSVSSDSPTKLGLFDQGKISAYEGPTSIKGKKVLARLRTTPAHSRCADPREGIRSNKSLKAIWTPNISIS